MDEKQNVMVTAEEAINQIPIEALFDGYVHVISRFPQRRHVVPPKIDEIHVAFMNNFYNDMVDFLFANGELDATQQLGDMDVFLGKHNIPIPSEIQMHAALHHFQISYVSRNNQLINGGVIQVW